MIIGWVVLGAVLVALIVGFALAPRSSSAAVYDDDDDEQQEDEPPARHTRTFFPGYHYRWEQIAPFLWALGYTRNEADAMYTRGFVEVWRNGFYAEFDATLGMADRADGEPMFACHGFDSRADTEHVDIWDRAPDAHALEAYR